MNSTIKDAMSKYTLPILYSEDLYSNYLMKNLMQQSIYTDKIDKNTIKIRKIMEDMSYSFNVTAPELQIDFSKIAKDLTSENPLAFVEVNGEVWMGYVVVEDGLASKGDLINGTTHTDPINPCTVHICISPSDFAKWKEYYQGVRDERWPAEYRNKGQVNVSFPSL